MSDFGQDLRLEREKKNISLKEISSSTRIGLRFLEAIEENRFDVFAGPFFIKAVIRSYAKAIGLDGNKVLDRYRPILDKLSTDHGDEVRESDLEPRSLQRNKTWITTSVVVLIVTAVIATWIISRKPKPPLRLAKLQTAAVIAPAKASSQAEAKNETLPAPPLQTKTLEQAPVEDSGVEFAATFMEETWIQVWADGTVKLNGLMEAGQTFSAKAQGELRINLGNAGGFTYTLNGKRGKPFGARGEVVLDIRITPETLRNHLQQNPRPLHPERP